MLYRFFFWWLLACLALSAGDNEGWKYAYCLSGVFATIAVTPGVRWLKDQLKGWA